MSALTTILADASFTTRLLQAVWAERVGWTLFHSLWQITAVAVLYAIVSALLRNRSASARYIAGCAALLAMVCFPLATYPLLSPRAASDLVVQASTRQMAESPQEMLPNLPQSLPAESASPIGITPPRENPGLLSEMEMDSADDLLITEAAETEPIVTDPLAVLGPWMPWATAVWLSGRFPVVPSADLGMAACPPVTATWTFAPFGFTSPR